MACTRVPSAPSNQNVSGAFMSSFDRIDSFRCVSCLGEEPSAAAIKTSAGMVKLLRSNAQALPVAADCQPVLKPSAITFFGTLLTAPRSRKPGCKVSFSAVKKIVWLSADHPSSFALRSKPSVRFSLFPLAGRTASLASGLPHTPVSTVHDRR